MHVEYTQQGYEAGNGREKMAVGTRVSIQAERQERTGQAGHRNAQVQNGDFRQRLFLMKRLSRTSKCTVHILRSKCGARVCGANIELLINEGCKQFVMPKTNTEFWQNKIENNRARDQHNYDILLQNGWQVIILWQCKLTKPELEFTMQSVALALNQNFLKIVK